MNIRELSDDSTNYSTTRWAFVSVLRFDIVVIAVSVLAYVVFHFLGKPLKDDFFKGIALLLGILTAFITASKSLQGFEPNKDKPHRETKKGE